MSIWLLLIQVNKVTVLALAVFLYRRKPVLGPTIRPLWRSWLTPGSIRGPRPPLDIGVIIGGLGWEDLKRSGVETSWVEVGRARGIGVLVQIVDTVVAVVWVTPTPGPPPPGSSSSRRGRTFILVHVSFNKPSSKFLVQSFELFTLIFSYFSFGDSQFLFRDDPSCHVEHKSLQQLPLVVHQIWAATSFSDTRGFVQHVASLVGDLVGKPSCKSPHHIALLLFLLEYPLPKLLRKVGEPFLVLLRFSGFLVSVGGVTILRGSPAGADVLTGGSNGPCHLTLSVLSEEQSLQLVQLVLERTRVILGSLPVTPLTRNNLYILSSTKTNLNHFVLKSEAGARSLQSVHPSRQCSHRGFFVSLEIFNSHENPVFQILEFPDQGGVDVPNDPRHHLAPTGREHDELQNRDLELSGSAGNYHNNRAIC